VEQSPVDLDRSAAGLLEDEDRALEVRLPRGTDRVDEVDETTADERPARSAARIDITVRRSRSSGISPVVWPPSTFKNRSTVNGEGDGMPTSVRHGS
jgi:hypothetical protein